MDLGSGQFQRRQTPFDVAHILPQARHIGAKRAQMFQNQIFTRFNPAGSLSGPRQKIQLRQFLGSMTSIRGAWARQSWSI